MNAGEMGGLLLKIVGEKMQKWVSKMKRRICPWSLMHHPGLHIFIKMKTAVVSGIFSSHQSAATCKTNKKTTVVFRHPSDGKVSSFLGD